MTNDEVRVPSVRVHQTTGRELQPVDKAVCKVSQTNTDGTDVEDWKRARRVRSQHAWFMREFALPARRGELG